MQKNSRRLGELINKSLLIETKDAKEAEALGFMARSLVQATMPHRKVFTNEFSRTNGVYTLTILAPTKFGLPYGTIPRLLISWVTTEAVRTKQREIVLGSSLSGFMERFNLVPTGGKCGSITRLKEQVIRLFSSTISCSYDGKNVSAELGFRIADRHMLWWDPKHHSQTDFWDSSVTLTEAFFNEITSRPIPVNMDALKVLKRSPMALDIYCWLTYRMSYLKEVIEIPWEILELQFGASYQDTRNFKVKFLQHLRKVLLVYSDAKIEEGCEGLILKPSRPHIKKFRGG